MSIGNDQNVAEGRRQSCRRISETVIYSCEWIRFGNSRYEYRDDRTHVLGEGSFGAVFRGKDLLTQRGVAIKRLMSSKMKQDEWKLMRSLDSPFLVALLDLCHCPSMQCTFLVMELCDTDLDYYLKNVPPDNKLQPNNLRVLIDNVARGYEALYEEHIVHRDLKPQNLLVQQSADGSRNIELVKITDFGMSRAIEPDSDEEDQTDVSNTSLSSVAGTLFYMAPEVGANLLTTCQYDFQVDMWSIGCVLYQCICGQLPFDESCLCRLFLFVAGANYDAYDKPEMPIGTAPELVAMTSGLLEIDARKRLTPPQFLDMASDWTSHVSPPS